jgi:2,3-bisphosphoglycerate-independent phosphoglycerate mutase
LNKRKTPLALIILDGFGYRAEREGNAIAQAEMPFYNELLEKYPHTLIQASGECVGLPKGVMGNSNVGHLVMGAGPRRAHGHRAHQSRDSDGCFLSQPGVERGNGQCSQTRPRPAHYGFGFRCLVHSSQEHAYALLKMAKDCEVRRVYVHCFLDGRDTPPESADKYVRMMQEKCAEIGIGEITTLCGRYYAMDRDKRWDRIERAYKMLVNGEGERATDPVAAVKASYERGVTDEFVEPIVMTRDNGAPIATIQNGDSIVFFNFRADRARQITSALAVPGFDDFPTANRPHTHFVCFAVYDKTYPLPVAFPPELPRNILAGVFAAHEVDNFRLAETEKYAHVTYFFNGGTEREFPHEKRLLVPSPKVATYDLAPEMSAFKITDKFLRANRRARDGRLYRQLCESGHGWAHGKTRQGDRGLPARRYVSRVGYESDALGRRHNAHYRRSRQCGIDDRSKDRRAAYRAHDESGAVCLIDEGSIGVSCAAEGALEDVAPTMLSLLGIEQPSR